MPQDPVDIPHVIAPPPLIYAVPLLIGLNVQHFFPKSILPPSWAQLLGPVLVLLGFVGLPAILAFRRAGTPPQPWKPVTSFVVSGPYRFTRNPMYVGFTLLYVGISVWVNTLWPIVVLPIVLVAMQRGVVDREEAYMTRRFGDEYRSYCARVRRWV